MIFLLHFTRDPHFFYQQNVCIFPGSQNTGTGVKISFAEHHQFVLARATSLFRLEKIQVHGKPVMIVKCPYLSLYQYSKILRFLVSSENGKENRIYSVYSTVSNTMSLC